MVALNIELTPAQVQAVNDSTAEGWFTPFEFVNCSSPDHPKRWYYNKRYHWKAQLLSDWVNKYCRQASVLDLFCANGAFSVLAALADAREISGVDADDSRIAVAKIMADIMQGHVVSRFDFRAADIHQVSLVNRKFDTVLCFGGLYHISDPAAFLESLRDVTDRYLIIQTSHVLNAPGSWGWFRLPRGQDSEVPIWPSETGGWSLTPGAYRRLIRNAGFRILEERFPPYPLRLRFRWYCAMTEKIT